MNDTLIFTAKKSSLTSKHNDEDFLPIAFSPEEIKRAIVALELKGCEYTNDMYTETIFKIFKPEYVIYQASFKDYDTGDCVFERAFI